MSDILLSDLCADCYVELYLYGYTNSYYVYIYQYETLSKSYICLLSKISYLKDVCCCSFSRSVGYRFGPHLGDSVPLLINYCMTASESDEELREYSLQVHSSNDLFHCIAISIAYIFFKIKKLETCINVLFPTSCRHWRVFYLGVRGTYLHTVMTF